MTNNNFKNLNKFTAPVFEKEAPWNSVRDLKLQYLTGNF